jgi:2-amino-4-hydroxy-6-hydroxymethyldihydropteridine diphosphokinase
MVITFLAMGSNLGDREAYLQNAIQRFNETHTCVLRRASIYETEPRDVTDQPWFLNTVIQARTSLAPEALLDFCRSIENLFHRVRIRPSGPRTLDIDIIFYGDRQIRSARLTVPHPRFRQRRFVLQPLAEIAPGFVDPVSHKTVKELLAEVADASQVRRLC